MRRTNHLDPTSRLRDILGTSKRRVTLVIRDTSIRAVYHDLARWMSWTPSNKSRQLPSFLQFPFDPGSKPDWETLLDNIVHAAEFEVIHDFQTTPQEHSIKKLSTKQKDELTDYLLRSKR